MKTSAFMGPNPSISALSLFRFSAVTRILVERATTPLA